jgi:thiosulfate dehydrogenase
MEQQKSDAPGPARFLTIAALVCIGTLGGSLGLEQGQAPPPAEGQGAGTPNAAAPAPASLSASAEQGKDLFDTIGCRNCHRVHGEGGRIGPSLSDEGAMDRSREWLKTQIRDPEAHNPQSVMFPFKYLSEQQVSDLVDYLESLVLTSAPGPSSSSLSPGARQGQQLFDKSGCLGCHIVHGQGGSVGPNLSNIGETGRSRQWLTTQIRDPKSHNPQTTMPAFSNMSDQQVSDLVDYLESLKAGQTQAGRTQSAPVGEARAEGSLAFNPPGLSDVPDNIRAAVRRGYDILHETHKYAPNRVGNKLDCADCHADAGMVKDTLSLVGVGAVYPKYDPTRKEVVGLAMRTNLCFQRYLNAEPLPADGNDLAAILTYYQWISKGIPIYANVPWLGLEPIQSEHKPDVENGRKIFPRCASCHGPQGQGLGPTGTQPLWGEGAFPAGPGMGQVDVLAAFVHRFMPKGNPDLTVPQALDVAAFVLSHPRLQGAKTGPGQ